MGITVTWVPYGPPAAEGLAAAVAAAKGGDPLAPVTVIVPSNYVGVATRRLLATGVLGPLAGRGSGVAAVSFLTIFRLGELLGAARLAAQGRRPVSTPVLAAAMRRSLRAEPGVFGPVAEHPATEEALVAAYRELREVPDAALGRVAAAGPRAADVVRLHRAARSSLAGGWYDEQDLLAAAAEAVGAAGAAALGAVLLYLPQRISGHGRLLIGALGEHTDVAVLAGATGDGRADAKVVAAIRALVAEPVPAPPVPAPPVVGLAVAVGRTQIVTTSDADDEVRAAVREIVAAARAGAPLERVAVLHASPEPYARLVHEHLAAAGIPTNGAAVLPLAARVAGRTLLGALGLADHGFRRQDLFALLAGAPVLHEGRWAPVTAWERLSRDAAVVAGRADWDQRLAAFADERDATAAALDADAAAAAEAAPWQAERDRDVARRARGLRAFALGLVDRLTRAAAQPQPWKARVRWAKALLRDLLGDEGERRHWPEAERAAADKVEAALDRLAGLDSVDEPPTLDIFRRTLTLELDHDLGRVGRFGEGVLVGSLGMGIGLDLDLVIVLGLAEGTLPARVADDSVLPDDERAAAAPDLPLRADRVESEHRELLAALAAAPRQVLGFPRGDLRATTERVASRWLLDVASALHGERLWNAGLLAARAPWVQHVPSFAAGVGALTFPSTEQEHRLAALGGAVPATLAEHPAVAGDARLAAGVQVVLARRSASYTRFDGNLAGLVLPSPTEGFVSPTRLEQWAGCPHAYLLRAVFGVEPVENPEEAIEITRIHWGNLVHGALEQFVVEVLARPPSEQPAPGVPWPAADRARLREIGEAWCARFEAQGLAGRALFWRRDRRRILADLDRFLAEDDKHRAEHHTRPLVAELAFGTRDAAIGAVVVPLPSGRSIRFVGRADRVDIADDGALHIVDYKTGRHEPFAGLSAEDPDERGTKLQLPVYGLAARLHADAPAARVIAEYWFVSTKGEFKRKGYEVEPAVLDRFGRTLDTIVDGIEAGVFPARPAASSTAKYTCPYCDPDGLGEGERRKEWERKRHDPALARYLALCEPEAVIADA